MEKHKPLIVGVILLIVLGVIIVLLGARPPQPGDKAPDDQVNLPPPPSLDMGPSITGTGGALPNQTPQAPIEEGEIPIEVIYTNAGYSPAELEISKGTVVAFKNLSSMHMWPASADQTTHSEYPTTGGCIGSTFDACAGIRSSGTWTFRFDIPGTWHYQDHLTPSRTGTIIVR